MPDPATLPRKTANTRLRLDLVEKLAVIAWTANENGADILDDLVRPEIERRFDGLPKAIQQRALDRIAAAAE